MYNGVGADLIKKCAENSIILIDCKKGLNFGADCMMCDIEMTAELIEVIE